MLKRRTLPLVLLIAVAMTVFGATFAAAADTGEKIQLRFEVPENQTLVYEIVTQLTMNLGELLGLPMPDQTIEERQVYSLEFGETQADGTTPFVFRIRELVIDGVNLADVLGADAPEYFMEMSGVVNARGGIEQIHFSEYDELFNELGIDLHAMLRDLIVPYPDAPVGIGDSWHVEDVIPFDGMPELGRFDVSVEATYTLVAIDAAANTATIHTTAKGFVEAETRITPDEDPTLPGEMTMYMVIEIEGEGIQVIDLATGQLISSEASLIQWLGMNFSIPGMPGTDEVLTMPIRMEVKMRLIDWQ